MTIFVVYNLLLVVRFIAQYGGNVTIENMGTRIRIVGSRPGNPNTEVMELSND